MKTAAVVIFITMYLLMILKSSRRTWFALGAAVLFVVAGFLTPAQALGAVNWNVLMMMSGTMIIVSYFIDSLMPGKLADMLMGKSSDIRSVIIFMSLFAGVISAFIDNVATVLMIAPVGLAVCKKLDVSPVPMILAISVSSNLQGAATLVGDTTSILLGDYAGMDFLDFFWMKGRPGIFFGVELGALATVPVMLFLFRRLRQPVKAEATTKVRDLVPTILLLAMIACLIMLSFFPNKPSVANGMVCLGFALLCMILDLIRNRGESSIRSALQELDLHTLFLLFGLFIAVKAITEAGVIAELAELISNVGGGNLFLLFTVIVWSSVLISAFVDNIPYVATMLPVISQLSAALGIEPYVLFFGLLTGATLGGNITPIGASANITGIGILKKNGYDVSFKEFMKIGLPFTLTAVLCGYLFIWFVWGGGI